jgi:hypothetical protein
MALPTATAPWLLGLTVGLTLGAVLGTATVSRGTAARSSATVESRLTNLEGRMLAQEVTIQGLQGLIDHVNFVEGPLNGLNGPHLVFEGVNIHVRSGSGATDDGAAFPIVPGSLYGRGNVIIGYNTEHPEGLALNDRRGSHNLVVGDQHRYPNVECYPFPLLTRGA